MINFNERYIVFIYILCSQENTSAIRRILQRVIDLYDFDILRDPIYLNIMIGMSIAIFAEVNFSMLTPFILADMGYKTATIANVMSILAIADLISRGAAPYLGEWLRQPPRIMYMISLALLIISRTCNVYVYYVLYYLFSSKKNKTENLMCTILLST